MNAVADPDEYALFKAMDELDRLDARANFLAFYQRMTAFSPPKHLKVIAKLCQSMEEDKVDRAMVFAPPRHIKTLSCSKLFPAWLMGRRPTTPIMSVVHTQAYAGKVGRAVRNYLRSPQWPFDEVRLSDDSQAREYWTTPQGGEYNGFGATAGNQHGSPAEWLFMDDIVKGREVAMSPLQREQIWENYETDMLSRLQGRRKQMMVFCMTGDTSVLMADGTSIPLRNIAPGDRIATYDGGTIGRSTVINAANQGPDAVLVIRMTSGRVVRANARHPFLVKTKGGEEWRRTDTLKPGDQILSVIGVSGVASPVPQMAATDRRNAEACVQNTTTNSRQPTCRSHPQGWETATESARSNIDTASPQKTMTGCSPSKVASVRSAAEAPESASDHNPRERHISASTIATPPGRSEACSAMTATSPSDMLEPKGDCSPPSPTYALAPDTIAEITGGGTEDVYDIQVDRTENFIANGLVSHNTRWHQDDPAGRILPENFDGRTGWYKDRTTGETWFVLCLPAVCEHDNDPVGRKPGEWLWPDSFGEQQLGAIRKRGGYFWSALYQQRPSPVEGLMFRAEHLQRYDPRTLPVVNLTIYIASDYAIKAEAGANDPDYTVHGVWGIDQDLNMYLLDGWRGRFTSDRWVAEWIRLCKKWKPLMAFEEAGQILSTIEPFLAKMMVEERVFVARQQFTSHTNKEARAQGLLGMASMGKLFLPKKEAIRGDLLTLVEAFEKEILQFPGGKHDDTVDQATLMARGLHSVMAGTVPKKTNAADETLNELIARHEREQERRRRGQ